MDDLKANGRDQYKPTNSSSNHPWRKANILSRLLFWWLVPIIQLGNESRALREKDLYQVVSEDESERLGLILGREWLKQLEKYDISKKQKPSFARTLFRTFGSQLLLPSILLFFEECIIRVLQPVCLSQLITYFDLDSGLSKEFAYFYATGIVAGSAFVALFHNFLAFSAQHIGMKARVASCSLIYRKSLCLSQKALCETTTGQMINLISNDVNRFDQLFFFINYLWIGPFQIIIATIVLYFHIGVSSLVGLIAMFGLLVPLQSRIGYLFSRFRREASKRTDERIRTINEIIPAIRVIKMNTWESSFIELTRGYRKLEMSIFRKISYLLAFNQNLAFICSKFLIFPTLLSFVLLGNELTPSVVFLVVALFNNVRFAMPFTFNFGVQSVAEARVTMKRIEDFLLLDEISINDSVILPEDDMVLRESTVKFNKVTTKWPSNKSSENELDALTNVSFKVNSGQLLAVAGITGSGKSTLLNVILGELPILYGNVLVKGKIAYCSQEPWIFNGSIRQMILCGKEMNLVRYNQVIRATALDRDLNQLPDGDSSIIGEDGVSLSGGQKARVNLARCLYVEADIYLLDDPLSAVDAHVASHIFQHAIKNFLRDKICVLVSHQLQRLEAMDLVLLLNLGRVEFSGTNYQFQNSGLADLRKSVLNSIPCEDESFDLVKAPIKEDMTITNHGCDSIRTIQSNSIVTKSSNEDTSTTTRVDWAIYLKYFRSGSNVASLILLALLLLAAELLFCASDYWLKMWTESEKVNDQNSDPAQTNFNFSFFGTEWILTRSTGICVYSILIGCVFMFGYLRAIVFFRACMNASIALHDKMFKAVLRAPIQFFDRNPVGTIINRFARDSGNMDDLVPQLLFDTTWVGLNVLGPIVTVTVVQHWLLLPALILGVVFWFLLTKCLNVSCGIKRLEASTKSPMITKMHSSLTGLTTLRAHQCQAYFQRTFDHYQDIHTSAWFLQLALARSLASWVDVTVFIYITCVTYTCVALRDSIGNIEAGLIISLALSLGYFQFGIRQAAEMENQMTSIDRIIQYSQLPSDHVLETEAKVPPHHWPYSGKIEFENVTLRYNSSDPCILKNISFNINQSEKIGIVGRSGAGKTSIIAALLRLTEPDGKIIIDGIDVKMIGLHDLRSKISIIPQEPTLFRGSLRFNLDPTGKLSDHVLWSAIKDVKLDQSMGSSYNDVGNQSLLDFQVSEGGTNLSIGQKQIVCLARVALLQNRILILDEATASIDLETDTFIQNFIREKFQNCTILTIAHRLNTIMDLDKIMVINDGQVLEFDEPMRLLSNPSGMFYSMIMEKMNPIQRQNS